MYSGEDPNPRFYQQYPSDFFDLIIIDECHRSGFGTWNAILEHFNSAIQLGMTATPKRDENIDTYNYFCQENNGNPAFTYSLGQGIEDGFLATYKVHKVKTNIDRDGLHIEDAKSQGAEIYCPEEVEPRDYYRMEQFEREIVLPDRTEKICAHLAMLLKTFDPTKKSMIFCVNADHARQVAKELQNRFSYLGFSNYAVPIIAEEPDSKTHYEQFQDSEKPAPVVATTVDLLSTGVDVPSVKNIIFIKPVGSKLVFKQIVGRGSRIDPITDKLWFRIVDYTNATRLFDDWDRPIPPPPPGPKGPRESYFQGVLLDEELYEPIPNGLVTVLTGPNEQVQTRSNAFGIFGFVNLPEGEVKVLVRADGFRPRQLTLRTVPDVQEKVLIELKQEKPPLEKIRIEGLIVNIAEETYLELEPTGQQLTVKEYIDHSRNFLLKSISHFSQLKEAWADPLKRKELLARLKEKSVYPKALASILKRPEADDFDILANVGFKQSLISREERATSFANLQQKFLDSYGPEAREVLEILLDKYRLGGVEEISPEIFRVAPFDKMGYAPGVAERFGGPEKLQKALVEIQKLLYKAEAAA